MSFDVNVLSTKPIIKAAANMQNDGGSGGNLGYMDNGEREQESKKQKYDNIFAKRPDYDIVEFQKDIPMPEDEEFILIKWFKILLAKLGVK